MLSFFYARKIYKANNRTKTWRYFSLFFFCGCGTIRLENGMDIFQLEQQYKQFMQQAEHIFACMPIVALEEKKKQLQYKQEQPAFYEDLQAVKKVNQALKVVENNMEDIRLLQTLLNDFETLIGFLKEGEVSLESELEPLQKKLQEHLQTLWVQTLFSGEYDHFPAVITLHAGAGGEEAQDWTEMLARMYEQYAEKAGFSISMLSNQNGDGAGIKERVYVIEGAYAYGKLKAEKGVHRLVRLSPFDANNRRHTSFASVEVVPLLENDTTITIDEKDLKIDTYRSGGAGGQHVNKTESAVRITHLPTGIVVQCQNERSQIQNREWAMQMLKGKLAELKEQEILKKNAELTGEMKKIEWGSQIRSYVLHPYSMVKDLRTNHETADAQGVLNGNLEPFIIAYTTWLHKGES